MTKIKDLFLSSFKEFKDVRCITLAAMLGAISIVLGSLTIMLWDFIKIEWTFLPNEMAYYLFGPVVGVFYGAAMDILNYLVKPFGAYFPGFTISAMLKGLLFGLLLYKRPINLKNLVIANLIRAVFIDLLLNTYWLTILNGTTYMAILPLRAIKILVMLPVEILLFYMLMKGVEASGILRIFGKGRNRDTVKPDKQ